MTVSSDPCQSPYARGSCSANCLALLLCGCASEGDGGAGGGGQADGGLTVTHRSQNSESGGVNLCSSLKTMGVG